MPGCLPTSHELEANITQEVGQNLIKSYGQRLEDGLLGLRGDGLAMMQEVSSAYMVTILMSATVRTYSFIIKEHESFLVSKDALEVMSLPKESHQHVCDEDE